MKWLSNTYDPKGKNAKESVSRVFGETIEEAWAKHQEWLGGKIIADPQATSTETVEQLKQMGMVGVYSP